MKIKDYVCSCGSDDLFLKPKNEKVVGIYCKTCGKWIKWADKQEKNLLDKEPKETVVTIKGKAEELAKLFMKYPDFDVEFSIKDGYGERGFPNIRSFKNISLVDVGHSGKIIVLTGEEVN